MNRPSPRKRTKDGLLYTAGRPFVVPPHLSSVTLSKPEIRIALLGCGGTGSQMLTGLGQIHASLRALNQQDGINCRGLHVTVFDPDTVSAFNVGRQLFYEADISLNKAECLVGRVNMAYGATWNAVPDEFKHDRGMTPDIVISCVDTAKARRELHHVLFGGKYLRECDYWLDCANLATVGQVVLGQPGHTNEDQWPRNKEFDPGQMLWAGQPKPQVQDRNGGYDQYCVEKKYQLRLPCVTELFPDLMDESFDETNEPSCSMVEALRKQSLFVNRTVSAYALDLLWQLIREGSIDNQGVYFNLRTRISQPIALKVWPVSAKREIANTDRRLRANRIDAPSPDIAITTII